MILFADDIADFHSIAKDELQSNSRFTERKERDTSMDDFYKSMGKRHSQLQYVEDIIHRDPDYFWDNLSK